MGPLPSASCSSLAVIQGSPGVQVDQGHQGDTGTEDQVHVLAAVVKKENLREVQVVQVVQEVLGCI